jgi:hypothetical protein
MDVYWAIVGPMDNSRTRSFPKKITFPKGYIYTDPPALALGFTLLDVSADQNIRVRSEPIDVTRESFTLYVESWATTWLCNATCDWFGTSKDDPDFQIGSLSTLQGNPHRKPRTENTFKVLFPRAYKSPPQIVLWLSKLDMEYKAVIWSIKCYATHITPTDFTIHIDIPDSKYLHEAIAYWIAYPTGKTGVTSGRFCRHGMRDHNQECQGQLTFRAPFRSAPRVSCGITSFNVSRNSALRIETGVSDITQDGMQCLIKTWCETKLNYAEVSYLALAAEAD